MNTFYTKKTGRITRDDFTYSVPKQDKSFFSFLRDNWEDDAS